MPSDKNDLITLATTVADGAPIDWAAAESLAGSDADRDLIEGLRLLERVAEVHAATSCGPADHGGVSDHPSHWGPLRIDERIGHGTSGDVYRAWDSRLHRYVALKLLSRREPSTRPSQTLSEQDIVEEGRLMARVRHPGVVTVHGADQIEGRVGVWMELVEGRTLEAEVRERGPLPVVEVIRIGTDVADALGAVHRAGLIHRDVKAQNVMYQPDGRVVLMDFGTGLVTDESAGAGLAGTPLYLAPEALEGGAATTWSDVYSLGVLLFFLTTGTFPVAGQTLQEVRRAHAQRRRETLSRLRPGLPRRLVRIIGRAIALNPADRFSSAAELAGALREISRGRRRARQRVAFAIGGLAISLAGWMTAKIVAPRSSALVVGLSKAYIDPQFQAQFVIRGPLFAARFAPCTMRPPKGIGICDLHEGTMRAVPIPSGGGEFVALPAPRALLSPDGAWLASLWTVDGLDVLHAARVNGTGDRVLHKSSVMQLIRWMPDGLSVVVREGRAMAGGRYLRIPADSSPPQVLLEMREGDDGRGDLSPDGKTMVVARVVASGGRDLTAIDVATGAERWRRDGPTEDREPRWSPDGSSIVYVSNAGGCDALYQLSLSAGTPAPPPALLMELGQAPTTLYGFGSDGDLLLGQGGAQHTVFRAPLPANSQTSTAHALTASRCEQSTGADWSSDGRHVAYIAGLSQTGGTARLVVERSPRMPGQEIPLPHQGILFGQVRWSPDGLALAASYWTRQDAATTRANALLRIDLKTARIEPLTVLSGPSMLRDPAWMPDGRSVVARHGQAIVRIRSASEVEQLFSPLPGEALEAGLDVSTTGEVAIGLRPSVGRGTAVPTQCIVRVVSPSGRETRYRREFSGFCHSLRWMPDGVRLLVANSPRPGGSDLWLVDTVQDTATRLMIDVVEPNIWDMSINPKTSELLFTAGRTQQTNLALVKGIR